MSGRYARHDPPRRRRHGAQRRYAVPLISCPGSHTAPSAVVLAPDRLGTISVFELLEGAVPGPAMAASGIQDPLFSKPIVAF